MKKSSALTTGTILLIMVLLISLLSLLISCTNQKTNNKYNPENVKPYPHIISIEEGLKNTTQLKLSEIADSIKYIVLDKAKEVLIGDVSDVIMNDSNILIKSENLVMRFDMSGKFLNSFGRIGRGPEEYLRGSPYSTTPGFDKVLVLRTVPFFSFCIHSNSQSCFLQ